MGGQVPYSVSQRNVRKITDSVIQETSAIVARTVYASVRECIVICKPDNTVDAVYFDDDG